MVRRVGGPTHAQPSSLPRHTPHADTNRAWAAITTFSAIAAYQARCGTGRTAVFFGVILRKESAPLEFREDLLRVRATERHSRTRVGQMGT